MKVHSEDLERLAASVEALGVSIGQQNARLERLDAFTESMFARVERAVRAAIPEIDRPGPGPDHTFTPDDRALLELLIEQVVEFDRRMRLVADSPAEPASLAADDRALLTSLAGRLDAVVDGERDVADRLDGMSARLADAASPAQLSEWDRGAIAGVTTAIEALERRVDELAAVPATPPGLGDEDRERLARIASGLEQVHEQLAAAGQREAEDLDGDTDDRSEANELLHTVLARVDGLGEQLGDLAERVGDVGGRLDALEQQVSAPAVPADAVQLTEGDRDLLTLIVSKLAGLDDRLQRSISDHATGSPDTSSADTSTPSEPVPAIVPEDVATIRSQAIQDVADAIERATGGLSGRKVRKLQRSLDRAAASASREGRPVRRAKPAPASAQRQMVHLEREPSEDD